jgi:hypothetical protein
MDEAKKCKAIPGQGLAAGEILTSALGPHGAFQLVLVDRADRSTNNIFEIVSNQRGTNLGGDTVRDRVAMTGEEIEALWEEYQKLKIGTELKGSYLDEETGLRWCENCEKVLEEVLVPWDVDRLEVWNGARGQYEHKGEERDEPAPGGPVCPDCFGEAVFAEAEDIEKWEQEKKKAAAGGSS